MDASAVISASKWIGIWLIQEGKYLYGVRDQVRRLQDELVCMFGLLEESDQAQQQAYRQETDQQLAIFTKKIRQIAFLAEDVIDTYILQVKGKGGRSLLMTGVRLIIKSPLIYLTRNQIDAITEEAKEANARLNRYRVVGIRSANLTPRNKSFMLETYAHTQVDFVIGFDDHVKTLVEQLTDASSKSWVIGIVGTGGVGKSTLARKVFHHQDVKCYFKHRAWVSISHQWSRRDVLYEILSKTRGVGDEYVRNWNWSERELVEMIYDFLKDKPYLLVLDDTWETKAWDEIRDALPPHHMGSKIIITTRMLQVPSYACPNCFVLEPRLLDAEESWELFSRIAIDGRHNASSNDVTNFCRVGKEMVAKCGGLPLALVTLAGLLQAQQSPGDWELINKACGSNILEYGTVDKIIALSYVTLPSHLKPCFLYLGVYPQDVDISAGLLTKLWIAEGLVTEDQQRGQETLEDVANRCLNELVLRCILQVVSRSYSGVAKRFRFHDLLRDFCIAKAKDQSFLDVFTPVDQPTLEARVAAVQARRATFHSGISLATQNPHLRSLIRFGKSGPYMSKIDSYEKVRLCIDHIYKNFKSLRVLNLWGIETSTGMLWKEIGNLIHLRFLAIKATNIEMFPKAIGKLKNLLTLDLRWNVDKGKVAFSVSNMTLLRHMYLGGREEILTENFGLHKLKRLQTLKAINAGNWMIKEMRRLSEGVKRLKVCNMSSVEQLEAIYQCPSIMFDSLRSLDLDWLDDENLKLDMKKLESCQNLRKLALDGRIHEDNSIAKPLRFPLNIVDLELWRSRFQTQDWMTTLGQLPYLKFLRLWSDSYEGIQLKVKAYAFPQLEKLTLYNLPNLEEWRIEEHALPCLKVLKISYCPKLRRLPEGLKGITTLQRLLTLSMPLTFCKRLGWQEDDGEVGVTIRNNSSSNESTTSKTTKDGRGSKRRSGEDLHIIQHVPTIDIWYVDTDNSDE